MQQTIELIRKIPFFKHCPDSILCEIAKLATVNSYRDGDVILNQGQQNQILFFLIKGSVVNEVEGFGDGAALGVFGSLVGEMSVIMQGPSTALIQAKQDSELLAVDTKRIQQLRPDVCADLQKFLLQTFSSILAEKLQTKEKNSKLLERTNLELKESLSNLEKQNRELQSKAKERTKELETQNQQLLASYKKMEDVFANRNLLFEKLEELLVEIKKTDLRDSQVAKLLEPVTGLFKTEKSVKDKRVLIIDGDKKQQVLAKTALLGTGASLQLATNATEVQEHFKAQLFDLMFFSPENVEAAEWVMQHHPKCHAVLMSSAPLPDWHKHLKNLSRMPQIVSKSDSDRAFSIKNIMTTVVKLATDDLFGLEKYLSWGVKVQDIIVSDSDQRLQAMEEMDNDLTELGLRKSVRARARAVAEEMLMNAIYDAPIDSSGKPLFNHLSRKEKVLLDPHQRCHLRFATDGIVAAVSVVDPFGSLYSEVLLKYLENCYGGTAGTLNKDGEKGGAGRGLHQIIETSDLVVFNVENLKKTEVICLFYLETQAMADKRPSFHFFSCG